MSGGLKGSNQVASTTQPPPQVMQQYQNVSNAANSAASNPYYFYPGQLVAGMSPEQTGAIGATSNIASALENPANTYGMAQPFLNASADLTMSGAQPITAGQINQYMNPYLQQVGQTTLAELNQNNAMQQQQLLGNAAASGALGGNRVGLAQSALANQQDLATNATLANINAQGFNTALGAAQTTAGQQLQGGFSLGQLGQTAENASLAGLNAGLTGAQAQYGMGTAEQQQQQNQLNAAYGQWLGQVQYPFQSTNFLAGVQSGIGSLSGGTGMTAYPSPSAISQAAGLGLTGAGIYNLLGLGGTAAAGAGGAGLLSAGTGADALAMAAIAKRGGRIEHASGGSVYEASKLPDGSYGINIPSEATNDPGYIGPTLNIAHGNGPPDAPTGSGPQSIISGFSSIPDVMKFIGGLKGSNVPDNSGTLGGPRVPNGDGGRNPRQSGGASIAEIPTSLAQQIDDYQEIGQMSPGSPIQKIQYQSPKGIYARGGLAELRLPRASGGSSMPMQGMEGISSLPLTGKFNVLSTQGAGTYQPTSAPGTWGNFALPSTPQAGNLVIPQTSTGANFAPVTLPGGTSSGPITNASGIPGNYFSAVQAAAPHPGWTAANVTPTAATATPTPTTPQLSPDMLSWLMSQQQTQQATSEQDKRGGRVPRADGGGLDAQTFPLPNQPDIPTQVISATLGDVQPRGLRNNNPLNLDYAPGQQGLDKVTPSDGTYGRYVTPAAGIAQATKQIKLDASRGQNTVRSLIRGRQENGKLVGGWSPDAPESYVTNVAGAVGVHPDAPIDASDPSVLTKLESAMWKQENGRPADEGIVSQGVKQGLGGISTQPAVTQPTKPVMIAQEGNPPGGLGNLTPQSSVSPIPPLSTYPEVRQAAQAAAQPVTQVHVPSTTPFEKYAENPWAAVTAAGLGMLSGTSPFAGINIGRGALSGLSYMQQMLPQERARQELQSKYGQQNVANVLTQRGQQIQSTEPLVQTQGQGIQGIQALPGTMGPNGYNISPVGVGAPQTYGKDPQTGQPNLPPVLGLPPQPFASRYAALSQMTASRSPLASAAQQELSRMTGFLSQGFYPTQNGAATFGKPASTPSATQTAPTVLDPTQYTGIPAPVKVAPQQVSGPNGQTMTYPEALSAARQAINSPWGYEQAAGQNWMSQYGPQVSQSDVNSLTASANTLQNQKEQLETLKTAANQFVTGATAGARMNLEKSLATAATLLGIPAPELQKDATSAQIIPKVSAFILSANARAASDQGGAQAMQLVEQATPGIGNTREGVQKLVQLYNVLADRQQTMSRFVTGVVQSGQMTYNAAVNAFNQSYPPDMWASQVDPIPMPMKGNQVDVGSLKPGYGYINPNGAMGVFTGSGFKPVQ